MRLFTTTSLVTVIPAHDFAASRAWYETIFGAPDEIPMENMAEWQIAADAWLQLDGSGESGSEKTAAVIGVASVTASRNALLQAGIAASDIIDYGIVRVCEVHDPAGNRLSFVEMAS